MNNKILLSISLSIIIFLSNGCKEESTELPEVQEPTILNGKIIINEENPDLTSTIIFTGVHGNQLEVKTNNTGSFNVDVVDLDSPILVKSTLTRDNTIMYSYSNTKNSNLNISPITNYIVNKSALYSGIKGGHKFLYQLYKKNKIMYLESGRQLEDNIKYQMDNFNDIMYNDLKTMHLENFDHFKDLLTNKYNYDYQDYLNKLNIESNNNNVVLDYNNNKYDTLNYNYNRSIEDLNITSNVYNIFTNELINSNTLNIIYKPLTLSPNTIEKIEDNYNLSSHINSNVKSLKKYNMDINASDYFPEKINYINSFSEKDINIENIYLTPYNQTLPLVTTIGNIFDGRTSDSPLEGVKMIFRKGYNERINNISQSVFTNANGDYNVNLTPGMYCLELNIEGYEVLYKNIVIENKENNELNYSLLRITDSLSTIKLEWDDNPSDLDSHLTIPTTTDIREHLSYKNKLVGVISDKTAEYINDEYINCSGDETAILDRDDVNGNGPETITLCYSYEDFDETKLYKYYVQQYSGISNMYEGNAKVIVNVNDVEKTFSAPYMNSDTNATKMVWHVFDMDNYGNLYPVNKIIGNTIDSGDELIE